DAAGIGIAAHVELARARQRARDETPVREVARVMDLDAGKPFERRSGDVVIVVDTHDRWIGIEAAQDRIVDAARGIHHAGSTSARGSRTTVHRTTAPSRSSAARPTKN